MRSVSWGWLTIWNDLCLPHIHIKCSDTGLKCQYICSFLLNMLLLALFLSNLKFIDFRYWLLHGHMSCSIIESKTNTYKHVLCHKVFLNFNMFSHVYYSKLKANIYSYMCARYWVTDTNFITNTSEMHSVAINFF